MSNTPPQQGTVHFGSIFSHLNQKDVEEFYKGYQYWILQSQIELLQNRLDDLHRQMNENTERIKEVQPTAIELATLARLQSNRVNDINLLDRMLERGELWLDRTMQRLDYLEQLDDFISDDYTQWCQHALEGAYDWIDSVLDGSATSQPITATPHPSTEEVKEEVLLEATEELFLQKISTDEDVTFAQEITMKRAAIIPSEPEEVVQVSEDTHVEDEDTITFESPATITEEANPIDTIEVTNQMHDDVKALAPLENATPVMHDANQVDSTEDAHAFNNDVDTLIDSSASEEQHSVESSANSTYEQHSLQEPVEIKPVAKKSSSSPTDSTFEQVHHTRPGFIKRLLGKIWGS